MPHRNPHSCPFKSSRYEAQTGLGSCGQEPHTADVLPPAPCLLRVPASWRGRLPLVRAGASEEMAVPRSFLPFCRLPAALPGRLLVLLPSSPSPSPATCPRAHSSFTSSTKGCHPRVPVLHSRSGSSRKLGLIILGLVHVNVPPPPREEK